MKKIAIIGSGDLGQQLAVLATSLDNEVVGYYDDFNSEKNSVIGSCDQIESDFEDKKFDALIVGVGYKHMDFRRDIFNRFKGRIPFANLIHKSVILDSSTTLGEGVVLYAGCIVDTNAVIKDNVLLNVGVCVAHDTEIGSHSFLSPRVALAGFIQVGECCILGINSTIIDNLNLCEKTQLGGGTVLVSNTLKEGLYVGVPAKFKK